jgi:hypothetical protein
VSTPSKESSLEVSLEVVSAGALVKFSLMRMHNRPNVAIEEMLTDRERRKVKESVQGLDV